MEINDRLKKVLEQLSSLELSQHHLDKQYEFIQKFEKIGVRKLFFKMLGSQEEQVDLQKQEYLQLALQFNELTRSIELMEFEQKILEEKLLTYPDVEKELSQLIEVRESQLLSYPNSVQIELKKLNQGIDEKIKVKREVYEAKIVGSKVVRVMEKMISHLELTSDWGKWENSYGPRSQWDPNYNENVKFIKEHIDNAQELSYHAKQLLLEFEDELKDVYIKRRFAISTQLKNFARFTTQYNHSLITDWVIHQRINNALNNIAAVKDQVIRLMKALDHEQETAEDIILRFEERKKEIILKKM